MNFSLAIFSSIKTAFFTGFYRKGELFFVLGEQICYSSCFKTHLSLFDSSFLNSNNLCFHYYYFFDFCNQWNPMCLLFLLFSSFLYLIYSLYFEYLYIPIFIKSIIQNHSSRLNLLNFKHLYINHFRLLFFISSIHLYFQ